MVVFSGPNLLNIDCIIVGSHQMIMKLLELDLCFDIIYQHTKFELNRCSLSKVFERTPIFVLCFYKRPITPSKFSGL